MGTALVKIKIMPESPNIDLETIKEKAEKIIQEFTQEIKIETEPVAFGLNSIVLTFSLDETLSVDKIQ